MKKLTLDETWKLCLSMWRWIAKMKRAGSKRSVKELKGVWCKKHGLWDVDNDCFFCEHVRQEGKRCTINSQTPCPGNKVDRSFVCINTEYNYAQKPIKFYNKLVSLNKKRKAQ